MSTAPQPDITVAYAIAFSDDPDKPYRVQSFLRQRDGKLAPRGEPTDFLSLGHARLCVPAGLAKQQVPGISGDFVLETWA